jgi:hypothetical protein
MSDVAPITCPLVYENQKVAVSTIVRNFRMTQLRFGLLRALVQAGKTGVYQYLIRAMMRLGLIDRAYIVCGSHETELRDQCKRDVEEYHGGATYCDNIKVVFRQDFKKTAMNTERCLIIVDESHLVQGVDQTLNAFMRRHGLTMAGTTTTMVRDSTYILSVDATPFAEEAAMSYKKGRSKFVVSHEPGADYYGPADYLRDGNVHEAFDLTTTEGAEEFSSLLRSYRRKYILVRIQSRSRQMSALRDCAAETGCDIVRFTSLFAGRDAEIVITAAEAAAHLRKYRRVIPSLESAPSKTTIVLIDGRLRCGKRVPKKHVGFVWETSKAANTDTIVQSLFGRMCGYKGDGVYDVPCGEKPLIFVPGRVLERQESNKIVVHSDLERYCDRSESGEVKLLPRFGTNIIPGRVQVKPVRSGSDVVYQCTPILFRLNEADTATLAHQTDSENKRLCFDRFITERMDEVMEDDMSLTAAQREEIGSTIHEINSVITDNATDADDRREAFSNVRVRNYSGISNQNMFGCHVEAHTSLCASKEHISEFPFLTFCIVHEGFVPPSDMVIPPEYLVPGTVFAIFYTDAVGKFEAIPKESRVSRVTDESHFTIHVGEEFIDCPAGSLHGFSPRVLLESAQFRSELDFFIETERKSRDQGLGIFSKRLTALNGDVIKLPCAVYGANLEVLDEIKADLESKWSTRITFEKARLRPVISGGAGARAPINRTLLSISWE